MRFANMVVLAGPLRLSGLISYSYGSSSNSVGNDVRKSVLQQIFTSRAKLVMSQRHVSESRLDGMVNIHIVSSSYLDLVGAGLVGEP